VGSRGRSANLGIICDPADEGAPQRKSPRYRSVSTLAPGHPCNSALTRALTEQDNDALARRLRLTRWGERGNVSRMYQLIDRRELSTKLD